VGYLEHVRGVSKQNTPQSYIKSYSNHIKIKEKPIFASKIYNKRIYEFYKIFKISMFAGYLTLFLGMFVGYFANFSINLSKAHFRVQKSLFF
jgi:hypothetical protein